MVTRLIDYIVLAGFSRAFDLAMHLLRFMKRG
jgi:hypothetical protein